MADDSNKKGTWVRDILLIPLIIGLITAAFTFGLPFLTKDKQELSYTIEGPTPYLDNPDVQRLAIEINGEPVKNFFVYRIKLWNSGDLPITELPVSLVFDNAKNDFRVLGAFHSTTPPHEFGEIKESPPLGNLNGVSPNTDTIRYVYALLNQSDQDIITVLSNAAANLGVYAKAKDLFVKVVKPQSDGEHGWYSWLQPIFVVMISFLTIIFREFLSPSKVIDSTNARIKDYKTDG